MSHVSELIASDTCLLLDFDGPVCSVFSGMTNRQVAERLATELGTVPASIGATVDPFDVLHYAATRGITEAARIEKRFTELESQAVEHAHPTPGAHTLIRHATEAGHRVAIVSNNSSAAIGVYLAHHQLRDHITGVFARTSADLSQLKPSPYLLNTAIATLDVSPSQCVFVGDSATDIEASRQAGIPVIAFANKPEKVRRFTALAPDALITSMFELDHAFTA